MPAGAGRGGPPLLGIVGPKPLLGGVFAPAIAIGRRGRADHSPTPIAMAAATSPNVQMGRLDEAATAGWEDFV